NGALAVGAHPRMGQTVQFQLRDSKSAREDLLLALENVRMGLSGPIGILLFSCAGRGKGLFGVSDHDADTLANILGDIPLAGFFCNGEIGPVGGKAFLHGYTASAAVLCVAEPLFVPVENVLKPNDGTKTPEPAVFSFSDYDVGAGEKLYVSTFEEALRQRQDRQRPHRHDFYQIFWMRRGAPSFNIDFYHFTIEARALVFVPPGAVHTFGEMSTPEGFILSFQDDFLEAEGYSVDLFAECPPLDPAQIRTVLT